MSLQPPHLKRARSAAADIQLKGTAQQTEARFIAIADERMDSTEVRWKRFVDQEWKAQMGVKASADPKDQEKTRFEFTLKGLDPGQLYDVTVKMAKNWSRSCQFNTKAAPKEDEPAAFGVDNSYLVGPASPPPAKRHKPNQEEKEKEPAGSPGTGGNWLVPLNIQRNTSAKRTEHVYTWDDMSKVMAARLESAKDFLGMEDHEAWLIMRHYDWNQSQLSARYWEEQDKVLKACGIVDIITPAKRYGPGDTILDVITLEDIPRSECDHLACGHLIHKESWQDLISAHVKDRGCTTITCPERDGRGPCPCIVPETFWKKYSTPEKYARYKMFVHKEFVSSCPEMIECVAAGCGKLLEFPGGMPKEVRCPVCGNESCPKCGGEAHRPAACSTYQRWNKTAGEEGATIKYLLEELKAALCPKCGFANERITGCNHMRCGQDTHGAKKGNMGCGCAFCYQCGDFWTQNGCGGYGCRKPRIQLIDNQKECFAIQSFFQQFTTNQDDVADLRKKEKNLDKRMEQLQRVPYNLTSMNIDTIRSAYSTVRKARDRLAWTFAIAFYIPEDESERGLFDMAQKDLAEYTNRLNQMITEDIFRHENTITLSVDSVELLANITEKYESNDRTALCQREVREKLQYPKLSKYYEWIEPPAPDKKPSQKQINDLEKMRAKEMERENTANEADLQALLFVESCRPIRDVEDKSKGLQRNDRIVEFKIDEAWVASSQAGKDPSKIKPQVDIIKQVNTGESVYDKWVKLREMEREYPKVNVRLELSVLRWTCFEDTMRSQLQTIRANTKKVESFLEKLMESIEEGQGHHSALNDFFNRDGYFVSTNSPKKAAKGKKKKTKKKEKS